MITMTSPPFWSRTTPGSPPMIAGLLASFQDWPSVLVAIHRLLRGWPGAFCAGSPVPKNVIVFPSDCAQPSQRRRPLICTSAARVKFNPSVLVAWYPTPSRGRSAAGTVSGRRPASSRSRARSCRAVRPAGPRPARRRRAPGPVLWSVLGNASQPPIQHTNEPAGKIGRGNTSTAPPVDAGADMPVPAMPARNNTPEVMTNLRLVIGPIRSDDFNEGMGVSVSGADNLKTSDFPTQLT